MPQLPSIPQSFADLGLSSNILKTLEKVGYITPSPIQEQCIKHLLDGRDVIGQAQTGTGKTAAFSLPLLDNIDTSNNKVQILVLTPTRELAIQVSQAMQTYAQNLKGLQVLSIYGGQNYEIQLRGLKKGVQVVVGTPGRVMDHIDRKTLKLDSIKALVLDEADEMLRMGFIDDVKWVLGHIPKTRQIALFSATMPREIKAIATKFLNNPEQIRVQNKTQTANNITQQYIQVANKNKMTALKRVLEANNIDGVIIFVRTKNDTTVISEQLLNFGYRSAALNGDVVQKERERILSNVKNKNIDIIVATDVAARGIDVARISHVINYDIPGEPESYIHRIGRTGRAGRTGNAILFVKSSDMRMLALIERTTKQKIDKIPLPNVEQINKQRIYNFKENITKNLEGNIADFKKIIEKFAKENDLNMLDIAASLALVSQNGKEFFLSSSEEVEKDVSELSVTAEALKKHPQIPMKRFRIEVGKRDNVVVKNIVGAIANEAEIDSEYIGNINILDNFSTVDLPNEMPEQVFDILKNIIIGGRKLGISNFTGSSSKKPKKRWDLKRKNSRNKSEQHNKDSKHPRRPRNHNFTSKNKKITKKK